MRLGGCSTSLSCPLGSPLAPHRAHRPPRFTLRSRLHGQALTPQYMVMFSLPPSHPQPSPLSPTHTNPPIVLIHPPHLQALEIFESMERLRAPLRRDAITYSATISALAKGKQWHAALQVFDHMQAGDGWGREEGSSVAELRAATAPQPSFRARLAPPDGFLMLRQPPLLVILPLRPFNLPSLPLQAHGIEADVVTCCSLINALERGGQWQLAEKLFLQMCTAQVGGQREGREAVFIEPPASRAATPRAPGFAGGRGARWQVTTRVPRPTCRLTLAVIPPARLSRQDGDMIEEAVGGPGLPHLLAGAPGDSKLLRSQTSPSSVLEMLQSPPRGTLVRGRVRRWLRVHARRPA